MPFYAQVRKTDDVVVSVHELTLAQAANFPPGAPELLVELTQQQYDTGRAGLYHEGSDHPKFLYQNDAFVAAADPRPLVTFTPDTVEADVGDVVVVDVALGNVNGERKFTLSGVPTKMTFVNGLASNVPLDTTVAREYSINSEQVFRVASPLQVTVYRTSIGPK